MAYTNEKAFIESSRKRILTEEEVNSLKDYAELFDKIIKSKNPAVIESWRNLTILIGLTQEIGSDEIGTDSGPGIFRKLANQVERSLDYQNHLDKHVSGLQYQIDLLRKDFANAMNRISPKTNYPFPTGPVGIPTSEAEADTIGSEGCDSSGGC